jgi:2-keto-4-pentenoate hydratase
MLSEADRNKAADILMTAAQERKQAVQISKTFPDITIDDSYAISTEVAKRRIAAGARLLGHKVGLTSKAMQRSSQIDEPDYGHLLDTMMIADGAKVPHENYCLPRIEVELAFVLGKQLAGPGVGLTDVLRATEYVVPALEIVDARIQDPRKIVDTVADNGACAGSAASCTAIPRSRRPGSPPACSAIPRWAWLGSPTNLAPTAWRWSPATWCWPVRSRGSCSPARVTPCTAISAPSAASRFSSCDRRK